MAGPFLPNLQPLIQAGIDPKTGLPLKFKQHGGASKEEYKRFLRVVDEQTAVTRFTWYNLPLNLTSQELEKMLFFKGQLAFFYLKENDEFYFMPYALDGTIDFYGRFNRIHPVPMTSGVEQNDKKLAGFLSTIKKKPVYGVITDEVDENFQNEVCVLLHDYPKGLGETIVPRSILNEPIIDQMAECPCYMRTSLIAGSGIMGVRVQDADQEASVREGSRSLTDAALNGNPWVPVLGNIDFQQLTDGPVAKSEEYMLAMQSLDNLRLSAYGVDNGGLFEKKAHELQSEADLNGGPVGLILESDLSIRQNFCNIVNSIWGLGIWCEPSENIIGADIDGDGLTYDRNEEGENGGYEDANHIQ